MKKISCHRKKERPEGAPTQKARSIITFDALETDPNGSYTGRPENRYEVPVQDADDL